MRRRTAVVLSTAIVVLAAGSPAEAVPLGPAEPAGRVTIPPLVSPPLEDPATMPEESPAPEPPPPAPPLEDPACSRVHSSRLPPGADVVGKLPCAPSPALARPVGAGPQDGGAGFDSAASEQAPGSRSARSVLFSNPDGTTTLRSSPDPSHYRDDAGVWRAIDTSVVPDRDDPGTLRTSANNFTARFGAGATVEVTSAEGRLGFAPVEGTPATATVEEGGDSVLYADVWPGVDLRYRSEASGVKEEIILKRHPGRSTFRFATGGTRYLPSAEFPGALVPEGPAETRWLLPAPVVLDDRGVPVVEGAGASMTFDGDGDTAAVTLGVDASWLASLTLADYPVVIDPWVWDRGSMGDNAYSHNGQSCPCPTQVGNSRADNTDVWWRSVSHFPYEGIYGKQVLGVEIDLWDLTAGTLVPYHVQLNHASSLSFLGMGQFLDRKESVIDGVTFSSGQLVDFYQDLADRSEGGAYVMFSGHEEPGTFTFKQFSQRWLFILLNSWPGVSLSEPGNGAALHTLTPTLRASGSDPDGDALEYAFQVCTDSSMTCAWSGPQGPSLTPSLAWNQTYWWRAAACDDFACAVSGVRSLTTENRAPDTPAPTSPEEGGVVTLTAQSVSGATADPDGDAVSYQFQVGTGPDPERGRIAVSPWTGATWSPPPGSFGEGGPHSFRVRARDTFGFESPWSAPRPFRADWRLGRRATLPYDELGPAAVNLASGNLVAEVGGPQFPTLGGPVGVGFTYNSQAPIVRGLSGDYWDDTNANGALDQGEPRVIHQTDPTLQFHWGNAGPADGPNPALMSNQHWVARWSGSIRVPPGQSGAWTFVSDRSDDTVKVTVNGVPVLSTTACCERVEGTPTPLSDVSPAAIQVDYTQGVGAARLHLKLKSPDGVEYEIPADWLAPDTPALPHGWARAGDSFAGAAYTALRPTSPAATVVVDATGADHEFKASGTGWQPPQGEGGVLTQRGDGTWSLAGEDGYLYRFSSEGRLLDVTSGLDDAHPGAPIYTYGSVLPGFPARLRSVTDASGRAIEFTYGAAEACPTAAGFDASAPVGMLCRVAYAGFGGGSTDLYYSSGHLARIVNPGDEVTDFGYDSAGRLTQVRDPLTNDLLAAGVFPDPGADAHKTVVAYDGAGRVTTITAPVPDGATTEGQRARHTYEYAGAEARVFVAGLLAGSGPARTVTVDALGHATRDVDAAGIATDNVWDLPNDRLVRTTRAGLVTTHHYDPAGRLTDTYGPAAPAEFGADHRSATAPHAVSAYDEGIDGLAAAWFDNADLAGTPKLHTTSALAEDWGSGSPGAGVPSDGFSGRLTGEVTLPGAGTLTLDADADAAKLWIDDALVLDGWGGISAPLTSPTLTGGTHRVRLHYKDTAGPARLSLTSSVPGTTFKPRYNLATSSVDPDGRRSVTEYAQPQYGLATAGVEDPGGLALRSTATYEAAGDGKFFRRTARTLPKGTESRVTYQYYGATETADVPCPGGAQGVNQAGALERATAADPDGEGPQGAIVREYRYDASGRVVAARVVGDDAWTCTTYDGRGRVTAVRDRDGKTHTTTYSAAVVTTNAFDSAGGAIGTRAAVDWVGRPIAYTDEAGGKSEAAYDWAGRPTATFRTLPGEPRTQLNSLAFDGATGRLASATEYLSGSPRTTSYAYDAAGRLLTEARPNGVTTTNGYASTRGWLSSISNARGGSELSAWSYQHSSAGRVSSETGAGRTRSFTYDGAGRLVRAAEGTTTRDYAFDANSNRCANAPTCAGPALVYDAADRLTSSPSATGYAYDAHGNLVSADPTAGPFSTDLDEAFTLAGRGDSERFSVVAGQGGTITSTLEWDPLPVYSTATASGSLQPGEDLTREVPLETAALVRAEVTWGTGTRELTSPFSGTVAATGTQSHVVDAVAGTLSAGLDWSPSTSTESSSGTVADNSTTDVPVLVSANGTISATLTWPAATPNRNLDLELLDPSGTVVSSAHLLTGTSETLPAHTVTGLAYPQTRTYTLRVEAVGAGSTFTLSRTFPVHGELDLELWRGATKVAETTSRTAKPETLSYEVEAATEGDYTLKAVSVAHQAPYTLTVTRQVARHAPLRVDLQDGSGGVISSVTDDDGTARLWGSVEGMGDYRFLVANDSSVLAATGVELDWSTTTVSNDTWNETDLGVDETVTRTLSFPSQGSVHTTLGWDTDVADEISTSSGTATATSPGSQTVTAAPGELRASLHWSSASTSETTPGEVGHLSTTDIPIVVSANGPVTATLTWPAATPNRNLDLELLDDRGTVLRSSKGLTGTSETLPAYTVTGISHPQTRTYTLRVEAVSLGSPFMLARTYPVTADVGVELWRGGAKVAEVDSGAKPETLTYGVTNATAGDYEVKVVSNDHQAPYSLSVTRPVVSHAPVTLRLKGPDGGVVESVTDDDGSVTLWAATGASGEHTLEVENDSTTRTVPSFTAVTERPASRHGLRGLQVATASGEVLETTASDDSPTVLSVEVEEAGKYEVEVTAISGASAGELHVSPPPIERQQAITYDAFDHAVSVDDGQTMVRETLAPSGRVLRRVVTHSITGDVLEDVRYGYDGGSDSPAYLKGADGAVTTYVSGASGLLVTYTGATASYPIVNGHGDVVGTTDAAGAFTAVPLADEWGAGDLPGDRLGWLGDHQRYAVGGDLGLIRMGVRLYDPVLGRFLSVDPIEGGTANDYVYVTDPVNSFDLDGRSHCTPRVTTTVTTSPIPPPPHCHHPSNGIGITITVSLGIWNFGWSTDGGRFSGGALGLPGVSATMRVAGRAPRGGTVVGQACYSGACVAVSEEYGRRGRRTVSIGVGTPGFSVGSSCRGWFRWNCKSKARRRR